MGATRMDWAVFGPAAVCWATGRQLPPIVDVCFKNSRPEALLIKEMLGQRSSLQVRYTTQRAEPVVDLEGVQLEPVSMGGEFRVIDPFSVLKTKKVSVLKHAASLTECLRVAYLAELFPDFVWPAYLLNKVASDRIYANAAAEYDERLCLALLNLDFDFAGVS
jgi:hypothetical protein